MHEVDQTNGNASETQNHNRYSLNTAQSLYKSLPISLRNIIIGVLFCWLGVVAVAVLHPHLNERWKFGADMTLNVLILLVVAVQAYIYARQWEVMQEQKRMATIGERAYLGVKDVKLENPIKNNTIIVHALLFNGGRTPAINVERRFMIGLVEKKHERTLPWDKYPDRQTDFTILAAGAERWLTFPPAPISVTQFQEFEADKRVIHAAGRIGFTDFMGIKQMFEFDMTAGFSDNGSFKETYQRQYDDPTQGDHQA
jgi:hypothetical protein